MKGMTVGQLQKYLNVLRLEKALKLIQAPGNFKFGMDGLLCWLPLAKYCAWKFICSCVLFVVSVFAEPLQIVEHPCPKKSVEEGQTFTLNCRATGFPYPRYVWFRGNTQINPDSSEDGKLKVEGARYRVIFMAAFVMID